MEVEDDKLIFLGWFWVVKIEDVQVLQIDGLATGMIFAWHRHCWNRLICAES